MRFTLATAVLSLLSSVSVSLAAPAADQTPWIQPRAPASASNIHNAPTENVYCYTTDGKWVVIPAVTVTDSIITAARLADQNRKQDGYPSRISNPQNLPGIPSGFSGTLQHYPIAETMSGTAVFNGRNFAENIRVMYQYDPNSQEATYVGVWTHANAESGQFVFCGTPTQWGWTAA
ncbi:hypothetical protein F4820DRAFT_449457 [Hypoxylon rubiginosum]|uniref:Uncharacterized protein n=1 Tax=Hypoxylon rubiginosum TaxID=110542 RepID=A0ACB9YYD9_9PEZI|nr:hypothetical protein F4820DRAFT_449457 [Hypoxylon rubiginosum]